MNVEGVDYSPEAIEEVRQALIRFRGNALDSGSFDIAVLMSHIIAYLYDYKELKEAQK